MIPTKPMAIKKYGDIIIYIEYYEDVNFSDIVEYTYISDSKFFWSVLGATSQILKQNTPGTYIIYQCKNGAFTDADLKSII